MATRSTVLQFPTDRSRGYLWATEPKSGSKRSLGEARGTVRAPVESRIHFCISDATDLSPLRNLGQDDLWYIDLCKVPVTDDQLQHLARLTGLRALHLSKARKVTDAGVAHFTALTNLRQLELYGTRVTDACLVYLRGMTVLEELHLGDTRVGNAGLVHLRDLRRLAHLNLHGTDVTDEGVPILEGMTQLKHLVLWGTTVTLEALERLKTSLPACGIQSSGGGVSFHALASAVQRNPADGAGRPDADSADKALGGDTRPSQHQNVAIIADGNGEHATYYGMP